MVSFPFCKINLGLRVLSKREDGFHEIETCFYPVPWKDVLEVIESDTLTFTSTGIPIPGEQEENICLKAYYLLRNNHQIPSVQFHLHKAIPIGAGLGGGSSDAAHTLLSLNQLFGLELRQTQLIKYAAQLGSDCTFFTQHSAAVGTGRGEILRPINLNLQGKFLVIVKPDISISTSSAYNGITPQKATDSLEDLLLEPISNWKEKVINDFEPFVFKQFPAIGQIKNTLYQHGALFACLSGSGSSVYGIFENREDLKSHFKGETYWSGEL